MAEKKLKVGDFVWLFSVNYRVYAKDKSGRSVGGPIYRESWRKTPIEEVTTRSYVVHGGHTKLPLHGKYITSEEELEQVCFVHENSHKIAQKVEDCHDYNTLKEIDRLLSNSSSHPHRTQ